MESHRKAESEADRKRCLENEGNSLTFCPPPSRSLTARSDAHSALGFAVNGLRDQLEEMKKRNQNSHISNEKNILLQRQVSAHLHVPAAACRSVQRPCTPSLFPYSVILYMQSIPSYTARQKFLPSPIVSCTSPSLFLCCPLQLDEANTLLRAESDAAARLRKAQTDSSKQLQQLETHVRELQDKCCLLESGKLALEKDYISLQAALDTETREHTQRSETISDLQGTAALELHVSPYNTGNTGRGRYPSGVGLDIPGTPLGKKGWYLEGAVQKDGWMQRGTLIQLWRIPNLTE